MNNKVFIYISILVLAMNANIASAVLSHCSQDLNNLDEIDKLQFEANDYGNLSNAFIRAVGTRNYTQNLIQTFDSKVLAEKPKNLDELLKVKDKGSLNPQAADLKQLKFAFPDHCDGVMDENMKIIPEKYEACNKEVMNFVFTSGATLDGDKKAHSRYKANVNSLEKKLKVLRNSSQFKDIARVKKHMAQKYYSECKDEFENLDKTQKERVENYICNPEIHGDHISALKGHFQENMEIVKALYMDLEKVSSTDFSISCNRLLDSGEDDVKIAIFAKCPVDNRPNFNSSIAYVANTPVVAAKDVSPVIFGAFPAAVVNSEESVSEVIPAKSVETYTVETVPAAPKVTNTKPEKSEKIKNIKTKKKNADVRKVAGNSSHFCPVNYERVASKCRMKCARFTIPKSTSPYACIPDEKSKSADNERRVRDREKNRKAWRVVGIVAASVGVAGLATWGIHSIFKDKGDDNSSNTFDRSSVSTFSSNGMAYGSSNSGHQHNYYYNQPSSMYNTGSSYGSYSEPTGSWYGNASYGYPSHGYSSYGGGSGAGTTPTPYSYGF